MAKPEWGTKRTCQSCGTRFYDLGRDPIICPKCGAVVEPEVLLKVRRSSASAEDKPRRAVRTPVPVVDDEVADTEVIENEEGDVGEIEAEEEEDSLIEDTSDIGVDEDDMAEVYDHVEEEDEER